MFPPATPMWGTIRPTMPMLTESLSLAPNCRPRPPLPGLSGARPPRRPDTPHRCTIIQAPATQTTRCQILRLAAKRAKKATKTPLLPRAYRCRASTLRSGFATIHKKGNAWHRKIQPEARTLYPKVKGTAPSFRPKNKPAWCHIRPQPRLPACAHPVFHEKEYAKKQRPIRARYTAKLQPVLRHFLAPLFGTQKRKNQLPPLQTSKKSAHAAKAPAIRAVAHRADQNTSLRSAPAKKQPLMGPHRPPGTPEKLGLASPKAPRPAKQIHSQTREVGGNQRLAS